jgi:hypothetical protein
MYTKALKAITLSFFLLLSAAVCPMPASAESITWDGDTSRLRQDPLYPGDVAFFPQSSTSDNIVIIPQNQSVPQGPWTVYGGVDPNLSAQSNHVYIYNDAYHISGGASSYGDASYNHVTINAGTIRGDINGGESPNSAVDENTVIINNGTVYGEIAGGYAEHGNVSMNNVIVNGGYIGNSVFGGASDSGSIIQGNTVTINSGSVTANVYGGYGIGKVSENKVIINDGFVGLSGSSSGSSGSSSGSSGSSSGSSGYSPGMSGSSYRIRGGYSDGGEVYGNEVNIYGGTISAGIRGGQKYGGNSGPVSYNKVNITGGTVWSDGIYGGFAEDSGSSRVFNNIVTLGGSADITLSYMSSYIIGGLVESGSGFTQDNHIYINPQETDKAKVTAYAIIGGRVYAGGKGDASLNSVEISRGTVSSLMIIGGESERGAARMNTVSIKNAEVSAWLVYGGLSSSGNAEDNNVYITNRMVSGSSSPTYVYGGAGKSSERNNVYINNGSTLATVIGGYAHTGHASDNYVEISNGTTVFNDVIGGYSEGMHSELGEAIGNRVVINNGTRIEGHVYGGRADHGHARQNSVYINGGTILGDVYGGWADYSLTYHDASYNTVVIGGEVINGTAMMRQNGNIDIQGSIYGGYANSSIDDKAVNNTVILLGTPDLTKAAIRVGHVDASGADAFSGNKLIVATDKTAVVNSIANAENYEFVLPSNAGNGYVALQSDDITFGTTAGGTARASKVTDISFRSGGTSLQPGDNVALFRKLDGSEYAITDDQLAGLSGRTISGRKGISLLYEFALDNTGTARVNSVRANPQTKALSEGRVAGAAFLNQGGDLLAYQGISAARAAADAKIGLSAFALTSGGWSRYNTGSHVDVSGVSLLAGLAIGGDLPIGLITAGVFFEGGWGNYDSYNSFGGYGSVKGSGDTSYVGGGVFGRLDLNNTGPGHFYGELSGRVGAQDMDFSSNSLRDPIDDRKANYDLDGAYYGLHTGLGYVWDITEAASLDLSGKYFWTHQEGGSVHILGDPFKFDDVDSHRVRAGGRFAYAVNEHFKPYIGASYEYEFSGEAKATTYERSIEAPDLIGSTGIGEIGVTLLGGEKAPLSLDLGVQGYTGMREGVTGSLQLKLEF